VSRARQAAARPSNNYVLYRRNPSRLSDNEGVTLMRIVIDEQRRAVGAEALHGAPRAVS
jgi:hypothetical protein